MRKSRKKQTQTETPISPSLKSVILHDWWLLRVLDNQIAVAGFVSRKRSESRVFISSPISRRIDTTTLETVDSITITISDFINWKHSRENGIPSQVCNRFQLGFPDDWEECIAQWCCEQSADRHIQTRKESLGTKAIPSSLDNFSPTMLRDLVMRLRGDPGNHTCDIVLGKLGGNDFQGTPVASCLNMEKIGPFVNNDTEETIRKCKKARNNKMERDDDDETSDAKETEVAGSKGVLTRSMHMSRDTGNKQGENRLLNPPTDHKCSGNKQEENLLANLSKDHVNFDSKLEEKLSSNHPVDNETSMELVTSISGKNSSSAARPSKASSRTKRKLGKEVAETSDMSVSAVRSSGRLKIRKNYSGMAS